MLNRIVCECLILDFIHQTINVETLDRNSFIPLSKVGFSGGDFHNTGYHSLNFPGYVRMYKMYANIHLCPSIKLWPSLYQISPKWVLISKYDGHWARFLDNPISHLVGDTRLWMDGWVGGNESCNIWRSYAVIML
jgi:hypothetical protein